MQMVRTFQSLKSGMLDQSRPIRAKDSHGSLILEAFANTSLRSVNPVTAGKMASSVQVEGELSDRADRTLATTQI